MSNGHGKHDQHHDDTRHGVKHYGEYPGALFLDSVTDADMIWLANQPNSGGVQIVTQLLRNQTDEFRARLGTLFGKVQPTLADLPAGYTPPANVAAACAKYQEFAAQKRGG